MSFLLRLLVRYLYPELALGIIRFLENLRAARADDPALLDVLKNIVVGISRDHPEWDWKTKRDYAFNAASNAAVELGKDLTISVKNTLLELLHIGEPDEKVPPDAARTLGSTNG